MQNLSKLRGILAQIVLESTARRLAESQNRKPSLQGSYGLAGGWTRSG